MNGVDLGDIRSKEFLGAEPTDNEKTKSETILSLEQKLRGEKHLSEQDLAREGLIKHNPPIAFLGEKELYVYYYPKDNMLFFFKKNTEDKEHIYEFWWSCYKQK